MRACRPNSFTWKSEVLLRRKDFKILFSDLFLSYFFLMSDTFSFIYPNLVFLENNEGVQSLAGVKRFFRHPTSGTVLLGVEGHPGAVSGI